MTINKANMSDSAELRKLQIGYKNPLRNSDLFEGDLT